MAEKRYYWLKLKRDFFKRHDIRIIEEMPNGKDYILFYLKMLLESIDHEGELRFSEAIPYNEQMLSVITNTNIDIVKSAMKIFIDLNMIDIYDDSTIYMNEVNRLIGSETKDAERKRVSRAKQKNLIESGQCPQMSAKCPTEKEIDTDIELKIENRERIDYQLIADMYNDICISLPRITTLSDARKKSIKARLNKFSIEQFKEMFEKAEASDFLKGSNDKNWQANFDWLIKDGNFAKVLDGNYNRKQKSKSKFGSYSDTNYQKVYERKLNEFLEDPKPAPKTIADDENIRARAETLKQELAERK